MKQLLGRYQSFFSLHAIAIAFLIVVVVDSLLRLNRVDGEFNNFAIFRWSFHDLVTGNDLYVIYPDRHIDLFKYSPTFALLMAPFWYLPRGLGFVLWNLLNGAAVFWAVDRLDLTAKQKAFVAAFVALELFGSIQNAQSNGLMAGLMIGTFAALEKRQPVLAALLLCLGFYVKLFSLVALPLALLYPNRLRFLFAYFLWTVVLGCLPLMVTSPDRLLVQYQSWRVMLAHDTSSEMNYSIMTLTERWFHISIPDLCFLLPGALLLVLPLLRTNQFQEFSFRLTYLASILVWVVIFNHKAESPTFIIAVCGIALWAIVEKREVLRWRLLWFVFVFTILSCSDVFPKYVKVNLWQPYCLKVLPCVVAWGVITWELCAMKNFRCENQEAC